MFFRLLYKADLQGGEQGVDREGRDDPNRLLGKITAKSDKRKGRLTRPVGFHAKQERDPYYVQ